MLLGTFQITRIHTCLDNNHRRSWRISAGRITLGQQMCCIGDFHQIATGLHLFQQSIQICSLFSLLALKMIPNLAPAYRCDRHRQCNSNNRSIAIPPCLQAIQLFLFFLIKSCHSIFLKNCQLHEKNRCYVLVCTNSQTAFKSTRV